MGLGDRAKRAARKAKSTLSSDDALLEISQMGDQWIVLDGEDTHGPYDDRKKAAAKYRKLKRERNGSTKSTGDESGGDSLSTKVSGAARRAGEQLASAGEGYEPQAAGDDDFGDAFSLGGGSGETDDDGGDNGLGFLMGGDGDGDGPTVPIGGDADGDGPELALGGQDRGEPSVPDFGGSGGDPGLPMGEPADDSEPVSPFQSSEMGEPMTPLGEMDDGRGEPQIPMLDAEEDDDQPPWMF